MPLKALEIEPEGENLTLDSGAFLQYNNSPFKVLSVPARVKFRGSYSPFDGAGIRVLYLQRGITEIVSYSFINCYSSGFSIGDSVVIGKNGEVFVFIPKTVTSIKHSSFSFSSGSVVNIIYEGTRTEWDQIEKDKWWIQDREEPDNIAFGETYYNSFSTLVDNLRDKYLSGVGIEVSDTISLKPATKDVLGGVKVGDLGSGIKNSSGKLSLEKADLSTFGGLRLGKGLYPSPDDSHGYGIVDVKLGRNLSFGEGGEINATGGGSGGYVSPPSQITIQGYKAYALSYLTMGHTGGGASNQYYYFPFGWLYHRSAIAQYMNVEGDFYQLKSNLEEGKDKFRIYMEIDPKGTYTSYKTYKESENGVKTECVEGTTGNVASSSASIGSGIVLCWEDLFPPGVTILGDQYENGCASVAVFSFYRLNPSGETTIYARRGNSFIVPFASVDEYNAAVGLT